MSPESMGSFLSRHLGAEGRWRSQNGNIRREIVKACPGLENHTIWTSPTEVAAVLDTLGALARLHSTRQTVLHIGPEVAGLEFVLNRMVSDGYQVLIRERLDGPDTLANEIFDQLLVAVSLVSDPWTGEVFATQAARDELEMRKIPHLLIEPNPGRWPASLIGGATLKSNEARVISLSALVAVVCGLRFRVEPVWSPWLKVSTPIDLPQEGFVWPEPQPELVAGFECSVLKDGFRPIFSSEHPTSRLGDRGLIYHPHIDGGAVVEALIEKGASPGWLNTPSLAHSKAPQEIDRLRSRGLNREQVRGLVSVSTAALNTQTWSSVWEQALLEINRLRQFLS